MKNRYGRGNCLKREAWIVCRFKGRGLAEKEGVVFLRGWGVDIPMHTMKLSYGDVDYFSY